MVRNFNLAGVKAELMAALKSEPWAILPDYLTSFAKSILSGADTENLAPVAAIGGTQTRTIDAPIAVLNISGVITSKPTFFSMFFGGTALTDFTAALNEAAGNSNIEAIVLNIDSPGGSVGLVPEAAAAIREARKSKPVVAVANTTAASAAYWLAAQADELVVTPSGMVGSIGVFMTHADESGYWDQTGVNFTLISAGKFKTEGNPYEPLSEEATSAMQQMIDSYYGMFTRDVAEGRGASLSDVQGGYGEGRMLTAEAAVSAGMADRIDTLDGVLSSMVKQSAVAQKAQASDTQVSALRERARSEYLRYKRA